MSDPMPVVHVRNLHYAYDGSDAVRGLNLSVRRGGCHALFGRNGAGKTTTMKCLLNLLQPQEGEVRLFGLDPAVDEVAVKRRIAYVPDSPAFYPWMTVGETIDYLASFRPQWNDGKEKDLLRRFTLDPRKKVTSLSKGQRTQLALIGALCPEPELLVLDEPTSGLDPIVRREFIETVIGAYQEGGDGDRTILVSTHLISEFEGLIDEFTLLEGGREILTLGADAARERYRKVRARFARPASEIELPAGLHARCVGRELEVIVQGDESLLLRQLREQQPQALETEGLSLEEIFLVAAAPAAPEGALR
ncbi:MAG TPA: ABC transporter ATP-binding protein [Verrucomicrobiales bacterium]|nr:ABC transporter ATP-binding protein [Verrucomicrobiales bacterium]